MTEPGFLCALDLVDTILLSSRSTGFQIPGWVIATQGSLKIDEVFVECDGKGRYRTSFPQPRPDVGRHYPSLANSGSSGFVTSDIPLKRATDESIDIRVVAKCNGVEHSVLTK